MKKFAALIIFLLVASHVTNTVYAAGNPNGRGFGAMVGSFFGFQPDGGGRPTNMPRPTNYVRPTGGPLFNQGHVSTGKPTGFVNPAAANVLNTTLNSYQQRLGQYTDFLAKVKSRRDKLAAEGKDVSRLDAFITTATGKLTALQNQLNSETTTLGSLTGNQDMGTIRKGAHDELSKIRFSFTDLHTSMSDAVSEVLHVTTGVTQSPNPSPRGGPNTKLLPRGVQGGGGNGGVNIY